ncbi:TPA: ADP-heptose--LPS heptosyltransferase, partial [Burkholderia multivorans]|nr:ADP-heptose--LPS heptosyltransferase [Burkholderia multivorans]
MTVATLAAPAAAAAAALSHDAALAFPGTLLAPDRTLVAPY